MQRSLGVLGLGVVLGLGCTQGSGSSTSSSSGGETPDAGSPMDAGAGDAAIPCDREDDGGCMPVTWAFVESVPMELDHHTTFVHESAQGGPALYVVGGVFTVDTQPRAFFPDVYRAPIQPNGMLGAWEAQAALPRATAFHAQTVSADGHVYLLAGFTDGIGGFNTNTHVVVGTPNAMGVYTWTDTTQLPDGVRSHATAHLLANHLYLVGGGNAAGTTLVNAAPLTANGAVGTWEAAPALPAPRSHHAAAVHDGRIYVMAGFDDMQNAQQSVLRSTVDGEGKVSGWETVGLIEDPPWTASAFVLDGFIYMVGGGRTSGLGGDNLAEVSRAEILSDGHLGPFELYSEMPISRSHVHQTPLRGRALYSVGGRTGESFSSTSDSYVGFIR